MTLPHRSSSPSVRGRRAPARLRTTWTAGAALVAMVVAAAVATPAGAGTAPDDVAGAVTVAGSTVAAGPRSPLEEPAETVAVRLDVPGSVELTALEDAGFDLTGGLQREADGLEVDALLTQSQLDALPSLGVTLAGPSEPVAAVAPSAAASRAGVAAAARAVSAADADEVVIARVDWFTTLGQGFLSIEAKSSAEEAATLVASWPGGSTEVEAYVDSGEYLYHRVQVRVDGPRPDDLTVTSSLGGTADGEVEDWLYPTEDRTERPGYQSGFVSEYRNPTELYDRIDELAREYPDLTEIVDLPYASNGYRRQAQATLGSQAAAAVVVTSVAWGHEGGNAVTVQLAAPTGPGQALGVDVDGSAVDVRLGSDADGAPTSTAAQVAAAVSAAAPDLVSATTYRGNAGTAVVQPTAPTALSDFLSAPDEISREPFEIRALRIGADRSGDKPGVLIQAQDHAREWVTPLVALETAERLLANYDTDAEMRRIVDDVDVFIIPSNNPDGAHYSFFDASSQRKSMTNHCGPERSDPGYRNSWGVDLNRNYSVGSLFDGFTGASSTCTSGNYAGPGELSEPEAKNVVWLAQNHPNLKFFMTVHSNGGQLFWQPGSYIADGRVTTPRPPLRDEAYYWQMAERILSNVKASRDTVVQPRNVGGSSDVLYSSAGNVREELYFNYGVYAFGWEIGGSTWDPETERFVNGSFQPEWPEANEQYLEYSNGVLEMFEIAAEWGRDRQPAVTRVLQDRQPDGTVDVTLSTSEPATIHYTTDGSTPTTQSPVYATGGVREGGETLEVDATTTFRYVTVDVADNVSVPGRTLVRVR